jgi:hypothetical protein
MRLTHGCFANLASLILVEPSLFTPCQRGWRIKKNTARLWRSKMTNTVQQTELGAFTFLGLLASEGQVPFATAQGADTPIYTLMAEEAVREMTSDIRAEGTFFDLMIENGLMTAEKPAKKFNFKIVRPTNLGGGFGGGYGGFGGGTVTAH